MKKTIIIMLCLLAAFAIVSCKHEPEKGSEPGPAVEEHGGILTVRPAEGAAFTQDGKFQFKMAIKYYSGDSIEFKAKVSSDVTALEVREGGNGDTFYVPKETALSNWEKDADGWYIITIPGSKVTPASDSSESLGITVRLPNDNRANCYVMIADLKIDGELVDFADYTENTSFVSDYYKVPDLLSVLIEEN